MNQLTLNEQSYLMDCLLKVIPDLKDAWELTEVVTRDQRGKLLALYYNKKTGELKEMVENIYNFQYLPYKNEVNI